MAEKEKKRGPGRPPGSVRVQLTHRIISTRVTDDFYQRLVRASEVSGLEMAEICRIGIAGQVAQLLGKGGD